MGSENHVVVVDVSSDEEAEADKSYFDFLLNKVFGAGDGNSDDEVQVISEVKGTVDSVFRKPNSSTQSLEDDDDCVILDGDPDKMTKTTSGDDEDRLDKNDDDVLVVGQKGEIACRDFPHPRHSCAKYSFNSTSHDKYCDMCHCYVCDIPAPCPYWFIGISTIDHCHANDKEKTWRNRREYFRTGCMPTEPSAKPTVPLPASSTVTRQCPPLPAQNLIQLSTMARTQVAIRPCSSSTHASNISSNMRPRCRIKVPVPHNVIQNGAVQSLSVRNNVIQKERNPCTINLRSRAAVSGTRFCTTTNGKIHKTGLYNSNAQVPQSNNHSSSVVPPKLNLGMYAQQQRGYCAAMPGQNTSGNQNRQFQTNPVAPPVTPVTAATAAAAADPLTVQQLQPGSSENILQTKLMEFESWLLTDQTGPVCPLTEPVTQPLTFDFETFLNN